MTLLLAQAAETYSYSRPFLQPLPVWNDWPFLLLPLLLAIAVVYKGIKVSKISELPKASTIMVVQVICAFVAIAIALSVYVRFAT